MAITEAITIVDKHLSPTNDRTMYSAEEVQDLLLDLRILLEKANVEVPASPRDN